MSYQLDIILFFKTKQFKYGKKFYEIEKNFFFLSIYLSFSLSLYIYIDTHIDIYAYTHIICTA